MWKINSNQAYLDISKIKNNFRIYSSSGYTLVCPKKIIGIGKMRRDG